MAPNRNRNANDDPRVDSSTKDKTASSSSKARRNPNSTQASATASGSKAASSAAAAASTQPAENAGINWSNEQVSTLHVYRNAHQINIPSAFRSDYSNAVLITQGIAAQSPTMAKRKDKRKVTKDQAALAVRKHFNNQAISETDTVVEFLYKVKNQDKRFKQRFAPQTPR